MTDTEYCCERKTPLYSPNDDLVEQLKIISRARFLDGESISELAYDKAIAAIKAYPTKITSGDEADKIKGIGPKIAHFIQEWITTGVICEVEEIKKNYKYRILEEFNSIYGIGSVKANEFYRQGMKSVDDLIKNALLNNVQLEWVKNMDDIRSGISRNDGIFLYEIIRKIVYKIDSNVKISIVGGFRRGKEKSFDLDILVGHKNSGNFMFIDEIINCMRMEQLIISKIAYTSLHKPEKVATLLCRIPSSGKSCQVDLVECTHESWASSLLSWTGSKQFERSIRKYAADHGYHLTNSGLYGMDNGQTVLIPTKTEKEIFDHLNLNYLLPEYRNC